MDEVSVSMEEMRAAVGSLASSLPDAMVEKIYGLTHKVASVAPRSEGRGGGGDGISVSPPKMDAVSLDEVDREKRADERYMRRKGLSTGGSSGQYQPGQLQGAKEGKSGK